MHLLKLDDAGEIRLIENFHDDGVPPYAILSHTWGVASEEVTFDDIINRGGKDKAGYGKIQFCARQALKDGLQHFWVDTCCINKAHLSELSESITSMFRWYQGARKCYAYLSDIPTGPLQETSFRRCKWFTRGWTLQELLAPSSVEFFSRDGKLLGSKHSLSSLVQDITGIPASALLGTTPLSEYSPGVKIQWASARLTTKYEDKVYCLQGIFNVYLLPNYGEKDHAFVRFGREVGASYESQIAGLGTILTGAHVRDSSPGNMRQRKTRLEDWSNALSFDQMDTRQSTIKAAYSTTCAWLLQSRTYLDWMDPDKSEQHDRFLWLKGKPGVGKSTLIKYAFARANESPNGELILSYFFNARGNTLEKSTQGMYRALLFQLIRQAKEQGHAEDLQRIFQYHNDSFGLQGRSFVWDIELLRELLTSAVQNLQHRRLRCFIDALDECDEQEVRDMVIHLENLGHVSEGRNFHVCFASRHYPSVIVNSGIQIVVENQPGHSSDLAKYIQDHLRVGHIRSKAYETIRTQISTKANGVFMWAVLVVNILNKELSNGRIFAIQKRLDEIPPELSLLFRDILRKDNANMDDLLLCIQWILFAKEPLEPMEFYCAIVAGLDPNSDVPIAKWDPELISKDDLERFVIASSKGLANLTRADDKPFTSSTVQFIHESVGDFLIKDGGLYELWPELRSDSNHQSHNKLRQCCQRYLRIDVKEYLPSRANLSSNSPERVGKRLLRTLRDEFPLLEYAVAHVFYHAEKAAKSIPQEDLLNGSYIQNWNFVSSLAAWNESYFYTGDTADSYLFDDALYFVSSKGYLTMAKLLLDAGANVNTQTRMRHNYRNVLQAASAGGHHEVVKLLLDSGTHVDVESDRSSDGIALRAASSGGYSKVVELLLNAGAWVNAHGRYSNSALHAASAGGHLEVVKILVDAGADINAQEDRHGSALMIASSEGYLKIVELLIAAGADVNVQGGSRCNALNAAALGGHEGVLKLLMDAGAGVDTSRNSAFSNTLCTASAKGSHEIVKLLLDANQNNDNQRDYLGNALQAASNDGHLEVVKLLLDRGAGVYRRNALRGATLNGHREVKELLLRAGQR